MVSEGRDTGGLYMGSRRARSRLKSDSAMIGSLLAIDDGDRGPDAERERK